MQIDKVLIDYRNYSGQRPATDNILHTFGIEEHYNDYLSGGGHPLKVAYYANPDQIDIYQPGLQNARKAITF